jgi:hypothetical protein
LGKILPVGLWHPVAKKWDYWFISYEGEKVAFANLNLALRKEKNKDEIHWICREQEYRKGYDGILSPR